LDFDLDFDLDCNPITGARMACLLVLLLLIPGCNRRADRKALSTAPSGPSIVDDLGNRVTLARPARRIASLSPSNTEVLFAIGCGGRVVLRDKVSSHPPEVKKIPATSPFTLSVEHVAGYSPEVVLLSHADKAQIDSFRRVGLPVATFDPKNLEQVYGNIRAMGTLCGAQARAGALIQKMRQRAARVLAAVKGRRRPLVYIETDGADPIKPWTAGTGSFVDYLLGLAGGKNLVARLKRPYVQINAEEVLAGNPDHLLLMGVTGKTRGRGLALLRARPGWGDLAAVRKGRVIDSIHPDLLSRPGPRLAQGLEALARALHPAAFK